tara:strand:- start:2046 stop:2546 length:501 start_codon:yes stop_codon:yes gene_type:complete
MAPPVNPWSASAFGSTFADAPGVLRENGWTSSYTAIMNAADGSMIGICSGSTQTATGGSTLLPLLKEGETMSIYGIQAVNAQDSKGFVFSLNASGNGEGESIEGERILMAGAATKNGPWFQHFELPMKVHGPSGLYWKGIETTAAKTYNYLVLQYIIVDETRSVIS